MLLLLLLLSQPQPTSFLPHWTITVKVSVVLWDRFYWHCAKNNTLLTYFDRRRLSFFTCLPYALYWHQFIVESTSERNITVILPAESHL
jgi:hypothetical protein